ncbi:hypothetical protein B0H10DRAFT_2010641 [Mycena sp. CBHHK59/15]|nr:hypothetical protein B0H10DRAFT_2010641 [Mycena sp. CBHHK59/15]
MSLARVDETPQTEDDVVDLGFILKTAVPAFPSFQYGYFYGTNCDSRRVVSVPMDYGVLKPASVNDLFTECWVPSFQAPNVHNMSIGRLTVDSFPPGSTFKMPFVYTLFWVPQDTLPLQPRRNTCPAVLLAGVPWYCNILVVRHGTRKPIISMDRWDAHLVDIIVASFISTGVIA